MHQRRSLLHAREIARQPDSRVFEKLLKRNTWGSPKHGQACIAKRAKSHGRGKRSRTVEGFLPSLMRTAHSRISAIAFPDLFRKGFPAAREPPP